MSDVFIAVGVQGKMRPYAFLGVFETLGRANSEADQYELTHGKPGVVLKARAGQRGSVEVYRSPLGRRRQQSAERRFQRASRDDPRSRGRERR